MGCINRNNTKQVISTIKGIARETLQLIIECSKSTYPNEFAGLLRAKDDVIIEVILVPGTENSSHSAIIRMHMLPNMQIVGSVHSHPSVNINPSSADLNMFSRTGNVHIIIGSPYNEKSWVCYDAKGSQKELDVVDCELANDELDDFFL